jgi:hypothetical protein
MFMAHFKDIGKLLTIEAVLLFVQFWLGMSINRT